MIMMFVVAMMTINKIALEMTPLKGEITLQVEVLKYESLDPIFLSFVLFCSLSRSD